MNDKYRWIRLLIIAALVVIIVALGLRLAEVADAQELPATSYPFDQYPQHWSQDETLRKVYPNGVDGPDSYWVSKDTGELVHVHWLYGYQLRLPDGRGVIHGLATKGHPYEFYLRDSRAEWPLYAVAIVKADNDHCESAWLTYNGEATDR